MKKLLILVIALALTSTANALVFSENFDHAMMPNWDRIDYQAWYMQQNALPYPGGPRVLGTFDGYQSLPDADGKIETIQAAPYVDTFPYGRDEGPIDAWTPGYTGQVANGVLRMVSSGSVWADQGNTGPFVYKNVSGDFVAQVQVVGSDDFWHNLGGLMARSPNPGGQGGNENWVCLDYFPVWGVGDHIRTTQNGVSTEAGIKGYPGDPYLKLTRIGTTFYFETSPTGLPGTWTSLPDLEEGVDRPDIGDVQVGIFQANFTEDWTGTMEFDNFSITPEPATIALLGLGALALIRKRS